MNSHDPVQELERRILPKLQRARAELVEHFPSFELNVWSSPTGSRTTYQGYDVGIECIFPEAADAEANCVALSIGLMNLTTQPLLSSAEVTWCEGTHPDISLKLLEHAVPASTVELAKIEAQLPRLLKVLREAIAAR